mmetsp:Transcript_5926/g.13003  ORF Transcript_5926/g.13003 Transcript_5926/m.13003 type:complete len:93 (+) Transcript_5926:154-432(+)
MVHRSGVTAAASPSFRSWKAPARNSMEKHLRLCRCGFSRVLPQRQARAPPFGGALVALFDDETHARADRARRFSTSGGGRRRPGFLCIVSGC